MMDKKELHTITRVTDKYEQIKQSERVIRNLSSAYEDWVLNDATLILRVRLLLSGCFCSCCYKFSSKEDVGRALLTLAITPWDAAAIDKLLEKLDYGEQEVFVHRLKKDGGTANQQATTTNGQEMLRVLHPGSPSRNE